MSNAGDADSDQTKELRFSKRDSSVSDASEVFPPQLESHLSWKVHKVPGTDLPTLTLHHDCVSEDPFDLASLVNQIFSYHNEIKNGKTPTTLRRSVNQFLRIEIGLNGSVGAIYF